MFKFQIGEEGLKMKSFSL